MQAQLKRSGDRVRRSSGSMSLAVINVWKAFRKSTQPPLRRVMPKCKAFAHAPIYKKSAKGRKLNRWRVRPFQRDS